MSNIARIENGYTIKVIDIKANGSNIDNELDEMLPFTYDVPTTKWKPRTNSDDVSKVVRKGIYME